MLDGDWKLQSSEGLHKVWLYDLADDPTEHHELSAAQPDRVKAMLALIKAQDAQSVKPMWPSLLQGPIFIDHPSGRPQKAGEEYILWDNPTRGVLLETRMRHRQKPITGRDRP